MDIFKYILAITIVFLLDIQIIHAKKVVFDFSDSMLTHTIKEKRGDYHEYIFENNGVELTFKDANWKISDNYYYLKIKKSSTIGSYITLTNPNAVISRVVFKFHSSSTSNKITYNSDNRDTTLDLHEISDMIYSACDIEFDKFYFKSTLGNSLIKEIIVYYTDRSEIEIVDSALEFNNNSNGGFYRFSNPVVVIRGEKIGEITTNDSETDFTDTMYAVYATDGIGGVCLKIPELLINSNNVRLCKGSILNNLCGELKVSYNFDDSFRGVPEMICSDNNVITFDVDNSLSTDNFIITEINPSDIMNDRNVNREFLLSNMELVYVGDVPYYESLDKGDYVEIPIEDKFGVLNTFPNMSGYVNFILSKHIDNENSSVYVAYPVRKETLSDVDMIENMYDLEDNVIYYNRVGLQVTCPNSCGVYIKLSSRGVEKIFHKN